MENHAEIMRGLRLLLGFGIPGGRSRVQRAIARYLDGDCAALVDMPTVKAIIHEGVRLLRASKETE